MKITCKYFDKLNKQKNWQLQHGLNGGEFYIKELGYYVDAYDKNKNIIVEYDEPYHDSQHRYEKDLERAKEIKNYLKCRFLRYKESKGLLYEI